ncbi:uncharacterized protein LOC118410678 [Branchiostoma floridae]|uniref:Uncharacterized protein LOC118410678 n=1 Tax=Branchiostoma floridae TaxID=7739 RepID=A0A9J7MIB0_BRAFL|nr:uncharacterized protein LOC118410678 [Branchiostoma floridae]
MGICALAHPWEGLFIGAVGALIACGSTELLERWQIDDPVGAVPVHFSCAVWSLISIGIFGRIDTLEHASQFNGLIAGGGFYLLGIQVLAATSQIAWTIITSYLILKVVDVTVGLRVPLDKEILGADYCEHGVGGPDDRDMPEGASEDDDDPQDIDSPRHETHFLGYHHVDHGPEHHHHNHHHRHVDMEVVERKINRRHSGGYCGHSFRQKHRIRLPKSSVSCCLHCCQCQCHLYDKVLSDCSDSDKELEENLKKKKKRRNVLSCCRRLVQRRKKRQEAKEDGDYLRRVDGGTNLKDVGTNTGGLNVVSQEIVTGL